MGNKLANEPEKISKEEMWEMKNQNRHTMTEHEISRPEYLKSGIKVKLNEHGKFEGLPDVWVKLLKLSPSMYEEVVDSEALEESVAPEEPDEVVLNSVYTSNPGKFIITIQSENEEHKIPVESSEDTISGFKGLPEEWDEELKISGFTKKQVIEDPIHVLETIGCIQRAKTGSVCYPLPTNSEYRKIEKEKIVFIKSDPSNDFTVLEDIGEGGFGKVYKCARKGESEKYYAMKYIDITSNKQKIYIGNEITIMKSMDHKNIVQLYEVYMFKGRIFMIMEYLDGGWLTPIVEHLKPDIPETVIAYILREVLEGIASLHKRGIIHRDIKSDNVLIDRESGDIKLTDFGYSCQLTQEKRMRESRVGTLYWMAPEVLKGNNLYDERWDIWSLGVFAFELAEGYPPFPKKGQQKTIYNILSKPPPLLKEKEKWTDNFHSFLADWMIKNPEERPKARELLKHPFVHDIDYEAAKQEYLEFKYKILKEIGTITDEFEETKFEGFEQNHTVGRGGRSKTIKSIKEVKTIIQ